MPFNPLTRWLRDRQPNLKARTSRLHVDSLEQREVPASLISSNFSLTGSANDDSNLIAVAARGRFAIYSSTATNIVNGQIDSPNTPDLFWADTLTGERRLVTAAAGSNGLQATGQVGQAVISADGLSVAFVSTVNAATYDANFIPSADAGSITKDVFVWSSATGLIDLASKESGTKAIGQSVDSENPAISANGKYVGFTSTRPVTLFRSVSPDQPDTVDVFRYDRFFGAFPVSINTVFDSFGNYGNVSVDPLGRYMDTSGEFFTFVSPMSADKLNATFVPTPAAALPTAGDAFLVNINVVGTTSAQLVSSVAGFTDRSLSSALGRVTSAIMAPDNPQAIIFNAVARSGSKNELVTSYVNNNGAQPDLYYRLMNSTGGQPTILVSAVNGSSSIGANSRLDPTNGSFVVSTDGSRVAFTSSATNLTGVADTNNTFDVFTWTFADRSVRLASINPAGTASGNAISNSPTLSADGAFVGFATNATNLTSVTDKNTLTDIVVRNLATGVSGLASAQQNGAAASNSQSLNPKLIGSGSGTSVAFNSFSTDLDPLFPNTSFGDLRIFSATVPIQSNPSPRIAAVSNLGSTSLASFSANGSIEVGDKFTPFPGFRGELRLAVGDIDGDGTTDIIAGAGPGGGPRVAVISGATGSVIRDFFAFEPTFRGGVYVSAGDFNGDGVDDVAVGADESGGSRVRIFSKGLTTVGSTIADINVFEDRFRGGIRIAAGDINNDGRVDLITGAGFGGGPRVVVFDGTKLGTTNARVADFFAFENSLRNGVNVSSGDFDGDGFDDLGIGAGPNGGPRVTIFSGESVITGIAAPEQLSNFFAFDSTQRNGVRVAIKNIDGDNTADVIVGNGKGGPAQVRTFSGGKFSTGTTPLLIDDFFVYGDAASRLGAWVG